jgi:hypothetical protein
LAIPFRDQRGQWYLNDIRSCHKNLNGAQILTDIHMRLRTLESSSICAEGIKDLSVLASQSMLQRADSVTLLKSGSGDPQERSN